MVLKDVVAIILGGGRGTRLHPLTRDRAKPAVPLAGKYRLIDIPISNCINSSINRIFILTQFLSASLHRHVYDTYKFDVFSGGFIELLPAEQTLTHNDWYQGTADAVRRQLHEIRNAAARDAVILAGDHLYRMDYSQFVKYHRDCNADITIAGFRVPEIETYRFGIMKTDNHQKIVDYSEKPTDPAVLERLKSNSCADKPFLASMGIYVFKMSLLDELLNLMKGTDFGNDLIPQSIHHADVYAYPFDGYWEDIGTIRAFFDANIALTQPESAFSFYERHHPIFTRSRFLPPSRVQNCTIVDSVLAEGSRLRDARISDSIIGLRGVVRSNSILRSVVMMGADFYEMNEDFERNNEMNLPHLGIGEDCVIERAIIDKNARIGNNVIIANHKDSPDECYDSYIIRDGIVVIPKNSVIPSGTQI
jgi:glucose-1-phosphate adenylyltransferase